MTVNGTTYVSRPLAARAGERLVRRGHVDLPIGLTIQAVGLMTPAR
jgi:hypothetical protein